MTRRIGRAASLARRHADSALVVTGCLYETTAVCTGRVPTISALCRRRRWIEVVLLAVLAVHLHDDAVRLAAKWRRNHG